MMDTAWERSGLLPLRDILKREHDEAQRRPRNEALEKWGPLLEDEILRSMERERHQGGPENPARSPAPVKPPKRSGPDMDMD